MIGAAKAEDAKLKFKAIHNALVRAMSNEHALLEKAKALKSQLEVPFPSPFIDFSDTFRASREHELWGP